MRQNYDCVCGSVHSLMPRVMNNIAITCNLVGYLLPAFSVRDRRGLIRLDSSRHHRKLNVYRRFLLSLSNVLSFWLEYRSAYMPLLPLPLPVIL